MNIRTLPVAVALAASLALAGCGNSDEADAPTKAASGDFPVTVDAANGEITLEKRPERIVSLSPSATEILFAIGAGDQVVAADEYSTYPEEAPATKLSGYDPNIEAIAGHNPDLVVVTNDVNDVVGSLEALDIPVILSEAPVTVEAGYDGAAALGLATGHVDETASVVADMRAEIDEIVAGSKAPGIRVYHELDEKLFAASSHSFIGSIYTALGASNVADAADKQKSGYPQLTEEAVISADPQLIVFSDQTSYAVDDVAARPGWDNVSAVREGNIVTVDADVASRWGPRLPQLFGTIADALADAKVPVS